MSTALQILEKYRNHLLKQGLSPATVERKLSSVGSYVGFLGELRGNEGNEGELRGTKGAKGLDQRESASNQRKPGLKEEELKQRLENLGINTEPPKPSFVSQLLVVRLGRRLKTALTDPRESAFNPRKSILALRYTLPYALKYKRPRWLLNYQKHPLSKIANLAILVVFCVALGIGGYEQFVKRTSKEGKILGTAPVPVPNFLSFQGRLTDSAGTPIVVPAHFRFSIYNSLTASASAKLYEEPKWLLPDQDGIFNTLIGNTTTIDPTIFRDNTNLWLGVTISTNAEMTDRQQIATVGYAFNAQYLQGYGVGSTAAGADVNQVPIIDGQGRLMIAAAGPTLQTSSGVFKIESPTLALMAAGGSGNVGIGISTAGSKLVISGGLGIGSSGSSTYTSASAPDGGLIVQGNVGFGTTSPTSGYKLDIVGNLRVGSSALVSSTLSLSSLLSVNNGIGSSGQILMSNNSTRGPEWVSGSSLSIGNADTLDTLHASSFLRSDTSDNYTSGTLTFDSGTTLAMASGSTLDVNGDLTIADTNIAFDGASTNFVTTGNFSINTNQLFVNQSSGKVGIGTSSPIGGFKLDVQGNVNIGSSANIGSSLYVVGNVGIGTTPLTGYKLDTSGNVRIGGSGLVTSTLTLSSLLSVNNGIGTSGQLLMSNAGTRGPEWASVSALSVGNADTTDYYHISGIANYISKFNSSNNSLVNSQLLDDGTNVGIGTSYLGTAKFSVMGGNVGIGTTSPKNKFEIYETSSVFSVDNTGAMTAGSIIDQQGTTPTTVKDSSGNANHGIGYSGVIYTDGKFGKSLEFDGNKSFVSSSYSSVFNFGTSSFTVEGFFKGSVASKKMISRYSGAGWKIYTNSSNYLCFGIDDDSSWGPDDSACETTARSDNQWHHFAAVRNGSTNLALYLDGILAGTDPTLAATGSISGSSPSLYFGIDSDGSSSGWQGSLDEIRILNTAQYTSNFNPPSAPFSSSDSNSTVGLYHFDEGNRFVADTTFGDDVGVEETLRVYGNSSWWNNSYASRRKLRVVNNSGDTLAEGTSTSLSLNTKKLYYKGMIQSDGDDIRIVYFDTANKAWTELDRQLVSAGNYDRQGTAYNLTTSEATTITFKIPKSIASGSGTSSFDTNYYMYYGNPNAATYDTDRKEDSYNVLASLDTVYFYDASATTYNDQTTEAGTSFGTPFTLLETNADYAYFGSASKFYGIDFDLSQFLAGAGSATWNYYVDWEYYDATDGWRDIATEDDNTSIFTKDGVVTWAESNLTGAGGWGTTAVNSVTKYWVRVIVVMSSSATTVPKAYHAKLSKNALLVCPFDGSTTCANAETPSTETGALRYQGQNSALSFDGANDYGSFPTNVYLDGYKAFTIEFFMKADNWGSLPSGGLMGNTGQGLSSTWFVRTTANTVIFNIALAGAPNPAVSTGTLSGSGWKHIAFSYNGSQLCPFVDGVMGTCFSTSGPVTPMITQMNGYFGSTWSGSGGVSCALDEIRLSNIGRYSSSFSVPTAPFVRDANTVILYHFDESGDDPRNTGKAIDDSDNANHGTITGAKYIDAQWAKSSSGTNPSSQSYASHKGIFVEEATTNLITNPSFENSTWNTNWTAGIGVTAADNTTAPYYKFGSHSASLSIGATTGTYTTSINVGNTSTHTLSAYVYNGTSGAVGGTVDSSVAKLAFNGVGVGTTYSDQGGGWWRLTYINNAGSGAQDYGVELQANKTAYLDGVQLEAKVYATTYCDGDLDLSTYGGYTGASSATYTWSGTSHNSTSSRVVTYFRYATSNNINANKGSLSFWMKSQEAITAISGDQYLFDIYSDASNRIAVYMDASEDDMTVNTNGTETSSAGTTVATGAWVNFVLTYDFDNDQYKLYRNGNATPIISTTTSLSTPTLGTNFVLGGDNANANKFNGTISDWRTFSDVFTTTEVADLYYQGLTSHQSELDSDNSTAMFAQKDTGSSAQGELYLAGSIGVGSAKQTLADNGYYLFSNAPSGYFFDNNLYLGAFSETIDDSGFSMDSADGADMFIADNLGVEGDIYSDGLLKIGGQGTNFFAGNVGLGYSDAGTLRLAVSGNVGIGTTANIGLLQVGNIAGGTPPLLVSSSNVGIGTTANLAKLTVGGNILPSVTNTYDLGSSSYVWNKLYANEIVGAGATGIQGYWQRRTGALSPTNITDDLLVGGIATSSAKFQVYSGTGNVNIGGSANVASSLYVVGNVGIGTTPLSGYKLDTGGNVRIGGSGLVTSTLSLSSLLSVNNGIGTSGQLLMSNAGTRGPEWASVSALSVGNADTTDYYHISGLGNYIAKFNSGNTSLVQSQLIDDGTNVGVGVTSPLAKLHVEGQCVAEGTLIRRRRKKGKGKSDLDTDDKDNDFRGLEADLRGSAQNPRESDLYEDVPVEDIQSGDEVLTFDDTNGDFVWQKVEKTLDKGVQETIELLTSTGKRILTTANHPYFNLNKPEITYGTFEVDLSIHIENLGRPTYIGFALEKLGFSIKIDQKVKKQILTEYQKQNKSRLFAVQTFALGIVSAFKSAKIYPSYIIVDEEYTGYDQTIRDIIKQSFPEAEVHFKSIADSSLAHQIVWKNNRGLREADSVLEPVFETNKKGQGSLKILRALSPLNGYRGLPRPHGQLRAEYYKTKDLSRAKWTKVSQIKVGSYIATQDGFEKVTGIRSFGRKQTYDLQIENTHNFVANGIVAHNTYINSNSALNTRINLSSTGDFIVEDNGVPALFVNDGGNVGIGTSAPTGGYLFDINGSMRVGGSAVFVSYTTLGSTTINGTLNMSNQAITNISSISGYGGSLKLASNVDFNAYNVSGNGRILSTSTDTNYFLGNVGIGNSNPTQKLDVTGNVNVTGTANITSNVTIGGGFGSTGITLTDAGNLSLDGALYTGGTATFASDVGIKGNLAVTGTSTLTGTVTASGNVGIGKSASVTSTLSLSSLLSVNNGVGSSGQILMSNATTRGPEWISTSNLPFEVPLTFTNGLTRTSNDIHLGGTLTENTTLTQGNYLFLVNNSGTANTRINLSSTGDFIVEDNGVPSLYVNDSGNVGIGTSSPIGGYKLDVQGNVNIGNSANIGSSLYVVGNVGIGMTPGTGYKLDVNGDVRIGGTASIGSSTFGGGDIIVGGNLRLNNNQILNSAGTSGLLFSSTPTTTWNILDSGAWQISNTANLGQAALAINQTMGGDIFTASASGATKFMINNSGNVGIGTTNPTQRLDVVGNINTSGTGIFANTKVGGLQDTGNSLGSSSNILTSTGTGVSWVSASSLSVGNADTADNYHISGLGNYIAKFNSGNTSLTQSLILDDGTNVGIAVTSPLAKLHIVQTEAADAFRVDDAASDSTPFVIDQSGNVGIGTTDPLDHLDVNGRINQRYNYFFTDFFGVQNTAKTTATTNFWDGMRFIVNGTCTGSAGDNNTINGSVKMATNGINSACGLDLEDKDPFIVTNKPTIEGAIRTPHDKQITMYFGLGDRSGSTTGDPTNGMYFYYAAGVGATTWSTVTKSGASTTILPASVGTGATAFQTFRIEVVSNSQVDFYINNVLQQSHTTNISTENLDIEYWVKQNDNSAKTADIDYIKVWQDWPPGNTTESIPQQTQYDPTLYSDLAEPYPVENRQDYNFGDLVSLDPGQAGYAKHSEAPYDQKLLGVISQTPGVSLGESNNQSVLVALQGRVSVNVSNLNGKILAGDYITSSGIKGFGMKSLSAGNIVGKALEDFDPENGKGKIIACRQSNFENAACGQILMMVGLGYMDPSRTITDSGDLYISKLASAPQENQSYQLMTSTNETITKLITGATGVFAQIRAGLIETKDLIAENVFIGNKLVTPEVDTGKLTADGAVLTRISSDYISPIGGNDLVIDLLNENGFGKLLVNGNAEFTGNVGIGQTLATEDLIVSDNLTTTDATITGELVAESARIKKLRVENIEGLEAIFATMSAQYISTANISGLEDKVASLSSDLSNLGNLSDLGTGASGTNEATSSAELLALANNWPITDPSKDIKITTNIKILGVTSLAQTIISGPLTQDGTFLVDNGNSINVLGGTLYLQNQATGGIDLLAGKVTIDKEGNAIFEGDLTIKGTLFAGLIKPANSAGEIVFDLSNASPSSSLSNLSDLGNLGSGASVTEGFGRLLARGANGETVFSLDASGSAEFKGDLLASSFKIARDAIAAEPDFYGVISATSSAGLAKIPAGAREVTIKSPFVTEKSLIYLTPIGSTENQVLYLARTKPEEQTFTPAIDMIVNKDILFSWWIVN